MKDNNTIEAVCPACRPDNSAEVRAYCSQHLDELLGEDAEAVREEASNEQLAEAWTDLLREASKWYSGIDSNYEQTRDAYLRLHRIHKSLVHLQKQVQKEAEQAVRDRMQLAVFSERPTPKNLDYFFERAKKENINVQGRDELHMKKLLKDDNK